MTLILSGCAFEGVHVTPREIECRAECTPDLQYIECHGTSEGTMKKNVELKQ